MKDTSRRVRYLLPANSVVPVLAIFKDKSLPRLDAIARGNLVVSRLLESCDDDCVGGARPSAESYPHALLKSHVIHLHRLVVSAYVNARHGQARIARLFAQEKLPPLWVPYADPGFMLARKIAGLVEDYQHKHGRIPQILFLEKHGVFVTADSTNGAPRLAHKVIERCESKLQTFHAPCTKPPAHEDIGPAKLAIRKAVLDVTGQYVPVSYFPTTTNIAAFIAHRAGKALLALTDIDEKAAQETADIISRAKSKQHARMIRCDVTSEDSVRETFEELLAHWGGLDILVNAAGIAPPYALVDMPADKWRLALEVNLTGYFLVAREAARIMIAQGMGGSIINLSSKSGLDASKNNTAYNATKAGELHMARGWALELGEHGIRVNCIAPGNVFEGSKIWNPQYIKVCAKKNGIRPEEVIPFYVNKTALRREIKGQDVADAVVFLCSDKARTITGQTLVADSGQVMVR